MKDRDPGDEDDFLEKEIAERTRRNPDYPRLLAEARARQRYDRGGALPEGESVVRNETGEPEQV